MNKAPQFVPEFILPVVRCERSAPIQASASEPAVEEIRASEPILNIESDQAALVGDAIREAVQRGAIPPRDFEMIEYWTDTCMRNPEAIQILAKHPGSPALEVNHGVNPNSLETFQALA